MQTEWKVLQRAVTNLSERCAAADPPNASAYRQEAAEFCGMLGPANADELVCLRADAEMLRRRWTSRIADGVTPASTEERTATAARR